MIRLTILTLFMLFSVQVYGQQFAFNYQAGYGFYAMDQLQRFQQNRIDHNPVQLEILSNYPAYLNHQLQTGISFKKLEMGIVYRRQSTGARSSYKDYSGELTLDTQLLANGVGCYLGQTLIEKNGFACQFFGQALMVYSVLHLKDQLTIDGSTEKTELDLYSRGILAAPGLRFSKAFGILKIGLEAGYEISFSNQDLHFEEDEDLKISDQQGSYLKPDWSGARLAFMVGAAL